MKQELSYPWPEGLSSPSGEAQWLADLAILWEYRVKSGWVFVHWLRGGIDQFSNGRDDVGRIYQAAADSTNLSVKTLQNYVSIARQFPLDAIPEGVDIGHAALLQGMEEDQKEHWLNEVQSKALTVGGLRAAIKEAAEPEPEDLPFDDPPDYDHIPQSALARDIVGQVYRWHGTKGLHRLREEIDTFLLTE